MTTDDEPTEPAEPRPATVEYLAELDPDAAARFPAFRAFVSVAPRFIVAEMLHIARASLADQKRFLAVLPRLAASMPNPILALLEGQQAAEADRVRVSLAVPVLEARLAQLDAEDNARVQAAEAHAR